MLTEKSRGLITPPVSHHYIVLTEMITNQHKRAIPLNIKQGDTDSVAGDKLYISLKFVGLYRAVFYIYGNKFEVVEPSTNVTLVVYNDHLKFDNFIF